MDTEEFNKERQSWKEQHPTVPSAGAGLGEGLRGIKMVSDAARGASGAAGMSKDVPVHIDPKLEATAAQMAQQPGGLGQLLDLLSQIKGQPNISTNVPTLGHGKLWGQPTTVTNSFEFKLPEALAAMQAQAPMPDRAVPDINLAKQDAMQLIQQHPDKAPAIMQRFQLTYGQPLQ